MKKVKKQWFLVEVTTRQHDYPCSWRNHATDIKSNLLDHDDVKAVKVKRFNPNTLQHLEGMITNLENEAVRAERSRL